MPSSEPAQNGVRAAQAAARKYGLTLREDPTGFADARHRSNGSPVQIKSALYEREGGEPGVFRLCREHLRDLAQVRGSVVLVVVNPSNPERKVLRVAKESPRRLLELAEWRPTGQQDMLGLTGGRVPWPDVITLR